MKWRRDLKSGEATRRRDSRNGKVFFVAVMSIDIMDRIYFLLGELCFSSNKPTFLDQNSVLNTLHALCYESWSGLWEGSVPRINHVVDPH